LWSVFRYETTQINKANETNKPTDTQRTNKHKHKGIYIWTSGDMYCGQFLDMKRHGMGELYLANGNKYSGEFQGLFRDQ
jgi:hypothetical protein